MALSLKERLEQAGIVEMWQRRTEAVKEWRTLQPMLDDVSSEISFFDRLLFFHHTRDELEERRLKDRIGDLSKLVATASAEIDTFWRELSKDEPDIARARTLEERLRCCLVARKASEVGFALQGCERWLDEFLAIPTRSAESTLEAEPADLLRQLCDQPGKRHLLPLAALSSLLELTLPQREPIWDGFRETLLYRPVLVALVGRVMSNFRQDEPANAFPIEIISEWILREHPELRLPDLASNLRDLYPVEGSDGMVDEIVPMLEKMAGIRLALNLNKKGISLLDRAVFWSDTPQEAREKRLRAEDTSLREEVATVWLDLERRVRAPRRDRWEFYAVDQALNVREAVRGVHTISKESSWSINECPLLSQEPAIWQTQALVNEVAQRYGTVWHQKRLMEEALAAGEGSDSSPLTYDGDGFVGYPQLPQALGRALAEGGTARRQREWLDASDRLGEHTRTAHEASAKVSLWDRVNVFTETSAEAAEKDAQAAAHYAKRDVDRLKEDIDMQFDLALRKVHQPALVAMVAVELKAAVENIRAVPTSRTVRKGDSTKTIYYCTLRGTDEAGEVLVRLLAAAAPLTQRYLAPLQALEEWATLDSPFAQAIHVLEMTEGNPA